MRRRANKAAMCAGRVLDKCTRIRGFSPHVIAIRPDGYIPGVLLRDFGELGCQPPEVDDDEKVPTQAGFYS